MTAATSGIRELLAFVYDGRTADDLADRLEKRYPVAVNDRRVRFDSADAVLISYADTVRNGPVPPLRTLRRVVGEHAPEYTHLHVLPFFPSSGDGGFSVTDFTAVDPAHGTWDDVTALAGDRRLMVDLVLNHVSAESAWFRRFLAGDAEHAGWFHVVDPAADLSAVFRPRTHPLLTRFETADGPAHVWTTFSADQVDLDFSNPAVLEAVLDVLAGYVANGARMLRLDAVGFVWKELGTPCLHHPKTHAIVKLVRAFLDRIAPGVQVVTETNVPHADNVAYFGDGHDEAQMVYNFSLPPLVLDAFTRGSAADLSNWAANLQTPGETTFFNFLASHDGIGMTPASPIIGPERVAALAERARRLGGDWSGRTTDDGTVVPYELNINYADALADHPGQDGREIAGRMLAAASIQFALQGVPGVYIHSHLGSRSWRDGPSVTAERRSINRERLALDRLDAELADPRGARAVTVEGHRRLLRARRDHPAFDPYTPHHVEPVDPRVFSLIRQNEHGEMWCVTNVSAGTVDVDSLPGWARRRDVLTGRTETGRVELGPYEYRWYRRS
ncbi:sucrose phosphorylase [Haloactinopolyspora alba]|uniref:Sucrose phosphorylase n=1 Tax=Haloactinopolyspora alba TaxID=648780 RepID=A0A2P8DVP8_9ACTN|nr:alpha-amylase family glycosyl hydrolase [Haloactinopolyspora alba]PSL01289.1 sucrose phosphorylase [Haloactinopolyspora alba]